MIRLDTGEAGFAAAFDELVDARRESDADVARDVQVILRAVRDDGEAAVAAFTKQFDGHDLAETGWRIEPADCRAAYEALEPELRAALDLAAARIRAYHEKQKPTDTDYVDAQGVRLGARWTAVDAAGLYVPGGRAAYPSSLLMNAIPAKVAFIATQAQFTPKTVETKDERDKLMFRIRVKIDPERLRARGPAVRSGLPGVAYVKLDPSVEWPPALRGKPSP